MLNPLRELARADTPDTAARALLRALLRALPGELGQEVDPGGAWLALAVGAGEPLVAREGDGAPDLDAAALLKALADSAPDAPRIPGAVLLALPAPGGPIGLVALPDTCKEACDEAAREALAPLLEVGGALVELAVRRAAAGAGSAARATDALRGAVGGAEARAALAHDYDKIIGTAPALLEVLRTLDKVVESEIAVLIRGESGTGKELVARAIHDHGPRKSKAYVSENCAALTETLLESELFGHVKGAFTGASANKKGLFEVADGGTLFLDEVGDMSLGLQKKVLRALQEGEIRPVGGKGVKHVDVRIISATNRPLEEMIAEGSFREDLYYRLNVVKLRLPPLRERKEDLSILLEHFIEKVCEQYKMPPKQIAPETMELLLAHDWPGNVRELENEVNRMLFMGDDPVMPDALSDSLRE